MQRGDDGECRFFQRMVSGGGHYAGAESTRQGIYVCSPGGELLVSLNSLDPERVLEALELGLTRWRDLPEARRRLAPDVAITPAHRWEDSYPEQGLVLTSVRRDLPVAGDPFAPRADRWNRDPVWFDREEAAGWIPAEVTVGATRRVASDIVTRLARFHLVDNSRGQTLPFSADEVDGSWLEVSVQEVDDARVRLRVHGESRAESDGVWRLGESDWKPRAKGPFPRGISTRCAGRATYDRESGRFVDFELVAIGTRWGRTPNNARRDADSRSPIGFVFQLEDQGRRIAPSFVDLYDASWVQRPGD